MAEKQTNEMRCNMFRKAEIERLKQEVEKLTFENGELIVKLSELNSEFKEIKEPALKIEKERNELRKMVREQTEADLLINALKAVGVISVPKPTDYFTQQNRLLAQQQHVASMNTSLWGFSTRGLMG